MTGIHIFAFPGNAFFWFHIGKLY